MYAFSYAALLSSAFVASGITLLWSKSDAALAVVPHVDLTRYQGKWYEIARLPTRFQRDCASDVTAQYTLQDDGKIEVLNACREANGKLKRAKGIARLRDKQGPNSKLKVRFFFFFSGDYWILDLDKGYKWVLVGTPNRRYLWILEPNSGTQSPHLQPTDSESARVGLRRGSRDSYKTDDVTPPARNSHSLCG